MGAVVALDWNQISEAVRHVKEGGVSRVEGHGWKVYSMGGNLIRIDIKVADFNG